MPATSGGNGNWYWQLRTGNWQLLTCLMSLAASRHYSARSDDFRAQHAENPGILRGTVLGPAVGMTEARTRRLSLLLAVVGALLIVAGLLGHPLSHHGDLPWSERTKPVVPGLPDHDSWPPCA